MTDPVHGIAEALLVLADGTGAPIVGATVTARQMANEGVWRSRTDRGGRYAMDGLPGGRYLVRAEAPGYVPEFHHDTTQPDRASVVVVSAEEPVSGLVFGLARRSPADFDEDGDVDFADVILFLQQMMVRSSGGSDAVFDLDGNGRLDFQDFLAVVTHLRGAGKTGAESGSFVWRRLDGESGEVTARIGVASVQAFQGYVVRVRYDPAEARFLGATGADGGAFADEPVHAFEDETGSLVIAHGQPEALASGSSALAVLRFELQGEATGTTLEVETGVLLTAEGRLVPVGLPPAEWLGGLPGAFRLHQNTPNPFNPATAIAFQLAHETRVELVVYNMVGQRVRLLVREVRPAGRYQVSWDGKDERGRNASSGVYFYRMTAEGFRTTRRMLLLR